MRQVGGPSQVDPVGEVSTLGWVSSNDATLTVRVSPRASQSKLAGLKGDTVLVRVTAPPVDGEANAAVCKLLAKALGVPKTSVSVLRGETSRDKVVQIAGMSQAAADVALGIGSQTELF